MDADLILPLHSPPLEPTNTVEALRKRPDSGRPPSPAAVPLEPLAVGREDVARLFSVSLATLARWDAGGQLGPIGIRKNGRKLWLLAELRDWANAGMPSRREWQARRNRK